MKRILLIVVFSLAVQGFSQGFLHQSGQNIVDGNGNNVLLRGIGLGGWMIQESYMLQTGAFAGRQQEIRAKIEQLIGSANTEAFYQAYRDNGITKADIDWLKAQGFNSIRLPMHYNLYTLPLEQEPVAGQNTWINEGFDRTDKLLQWCTDNGMYLILDMHAAPGGQGKDTNISDYDPSKPSLWESEGNRNKMVALWKQLAERYKDNKWIGGYDLINEPNWSFTGSNPNGCDEVSNAPLRQLMVDITSAIRQVDVNHMIIAEGNCWGNNYNGIFPLWDSNMALSFHRYGTDNSVASIQDMLNYRSQYNVPIWLGESGENSNMWFRDNIKLCESNNIGWSWWPMKKVESTACLADVKKSPGYQQLLDYWTNGGIAPTQAYATTALMQLAKNFNFNNVITKSDVVDAMFRQIQSDQTIPYADHILPGKIYANTYDLGAKGLAYNDFDTPGQPYNQGYANRNDGVDIQLCSDTNTNGFQVGYIQTGEWLMYTITAAELKSYDVDIRYAGPGGALHLEDQAGKISEKIILPSTGNSNTWATVTLKDILLKAGINKIKVYFDAGGFNLNYLEFKNQANSTSVPLKVIYLETNDLGDQIMVSFNKNLKPSIDLNTSGLSLKTNNNNLEINSISQKSDNSFIIKTPAVINTGDVITLTYAGTNLLGEDDTLLPAFTDKNVDNKTGEIQEIPAIIQAESYVTNNGLSQEATSDTGGGQNIGQTDKGDYLEYLVNIKQAGNYRIEYRTAGYQTGEIKLQLINNVTLDIQTVSLLPTNGWQTWATTSSQAQLPAGRYYLRILINEPGFNLNWIKFSFQEQDDDNDGISNKDDICPNTPVNTVVDFNGCKLFTLAANNFSVKTISESCRSANNGSIEIKTIENHSYTAKLTGKSNQSINFTTNATFTGLEAGNYQLCFTLPESISYQQCFDVIITEPENLAVTSKFLESTKQVELDLSGSQIYTIKHNNALYTTNQSTIVLTLRPGKNTFEVKADKDCQGIYTTAFEVDSKPVVYPNPVKGDHIYINIPATQEKIFITIYKIQGEKVISKEFDTQDDVIAINTSDLPKGVYIVNIVAGSYLYNTKIIK